VADSCEAAGRGEDRGNAGVKHAEVITARLVQDERGWLRLAGWIHRAADLPDGRLWQTPRAA